MQQMISKTKTYYARVALSYGAVKKGSTTSTAYSPSFYMHLKDPHAHWEMIQALENRFRVEECSFNSIFGTFEGHRIFASRKVAEKIEIQTRYAAELFNVDVRQDQRYLAEKDLFPCGERDESRFSPDFEIPLSILGMEVAGDPNFPKGYHLRPGPQ
jgi:DNA polymerase, archaea type